MGVVESEKSKSEKSRDWSNENTASGGSGKRSEGGVKKLDISDQTNLRQNGIPAKMRNISSLNS
jgi:hypothetical protein